MGGEAAAMGREVMLFYEIINKHPAESPALVCQDKMLTYGQLRAEITLWAWRICKATVSVRATRWAF